MRVYIRYGAEYQHPNFTTSYENNFGIVNF